MATPFRVLVVDDENSVRVLLVSVLSKAGYDVLAFETGEVALNELKLRPAQLMISDMSLPNIDGLELFKQARALRPALQAILITGYPKRDVREAALKAGVLDYVIKPFQVADILAVCEEAIQIASSTVAASARR